MPLNNPTYVSWRAMMGRCYRPSTRGYEHYGGRGIRVCLRWQESWKNFLADMGPRPKGKELGRIDNNGHYCAENCSWQTRKENSRNKRNNRFVIYKGNRIVLSEAVELSGLNKSSVCGRLRRGFAGDLSNIVFNPKQKLKPEQVLEIRALTGGARPVARKYGISRALVRKIRNRIVWKHL